MQLGQLDTRARLWAEVHAVISELRILGYDDRDLRGLSIDDLWRLQYGAALPCAQ